MAEKKTKVRLLMDTKVDGIDYLAGAAIEFPEKTAKSLLAAGSADDHRDAVEYAIAECGACALHKVEAIESTDDGSSSGNVTT